jgi:hypothetical protein
VEELRDLGSACGVLDFMLPCLEEEEEEVLSLLVGALLFGLPE